MQAPAQSMHELKNRNRLVFDDAFHHQLAGRVQNRDRNRVLVNIHPDILRAFHRRVLLSDGETANAHSLIQGASSYIASRFREVRGCDPESREASNEREAPMYNSQLQVIFASEDLNNG